MLMECQVCRFLDLSAQVDNNEYESDENNEPLSGVLIRLNST